MNNLLRIVDTARKEEIFAYEVLKDFVFYDKITYIGDDVQNGLADIFTDDYTIGVEVISCERRVVHKFTERNKLPVKFSMKIKSDKLVEKSKDKLSNVTMPQEEFYHNLKVGITKKLKLLKEGNYSGTKEIFLCICSVYEMKEYIDLNKVAKMYKECSQKIGVSFGVVFLIVNNKLYMINNNSEFTLVEEYNGSHIQVKKIIK